MKSFAVWSLVALNAALLMFIIDRKLPDNTAQAQMAGRPGDYLMIPGEVIGANNAIVYVVDQSNHLLSAVTYDDSSGTIATMPPLSLDRIFSNVGKMGR